MILIAAAMMLTSSLTAQSIRKDNQTKAKAFQHLDVAFTAGTPGLGFDFSTPITDFMQVRMGASFVPKIKPTMSFPIQVGESQSNFNILSNRLEELTGYRVDNNVDMKGEPTFNNFKFMVDFFPFKNKHWHFTVGFYAGPRTIARAYNTTEDMPSLVGVNIYNHMYKKAVAGEPVISIPGTDGNPGIDIYREDLVAFGPMGVHVGNYAHDVYYSENVYATKDFQRYFDKDGNEQYAMAGDIIHYAGELKHAAGDPYLLEPDANCMVKAKLKVNAFRPYLGFGYGGRLLKNNDMYHVAFDCGIMMWGGTPQVITHDGTDLTKDVTDISGKVGDYVKAAKRLKVFPVIDLRLVRRF